MYAIQLLNFLERIMFYGKLKNNNFCEFFFNYFLNYLLKESLPLKASEDFAFYT